MLGSVEGTVAAKRSPILGYNHNVRYRGVIFHVQTEDSGIHNPHIFTHLFHGGIILSTRKLVYDNDAAEESVKSLMQAQHKAALKDLKNGQFDDKIDLLLADVEGLLPRGVVEQAADEASAPVSAAQAADASSRPTERLGPESVIAAAKSNGGAAPPVRAMTQPRVASQAFPPIPPPVPPRSGAIPPPVPTRALGTESEAAPPERVERKREVSDAFEAIVVPDKDLAEAGMLEEPAQVHSPAPASAAMPPGAAPGRSGSYAQHRRRETGMGFEAEPPPPTPAISRAHRPSDVVPPPEAPRPRTPTPASGPARVPQARTVSPAGRPPVPSSPMARTQPLSTPPPATARTITQPVRSNPPSSPPGLRGGPPGARARQPTGGNVVLSRPAVIIGAPPKVVGASPQARGTQTRVRKAREESESGMFGQDLISEKSLDEVILAYLSEDAGEE